MKTLSNSQRTIYLTYFHKTQSKPVIKQTVTMQVRKELNPTQNYYYY